jgi:MacB-like protein
MSFDPSGAAAMKTICRSVMCVLLLVSCTPESPLPEYDASLIEMSSGVVATTTAGRFNVSVAAVPAGFFADERWRPTLGRLFMAEDHAADSQPVAVLSHGFWVQIGEHPILVGSTILVGETERVVIGVLAEGLAAASNAQIWTPR